jgi:hypothetical protein
MFETSDFKIDEHGIDFKKNYQFSKHIDYREISLIKIKKGYNTKNWFTSFIIGLFVLIVSIYWCLALAFRYKSNIFNWL